MRTDFLIFLSSLSNIASILATNFTNSFEFVMADSFRSAFPPIVTADITEDIPIVSSFCHADGHISASLSTIATEHDPDIIPNVSPMTSLHTFDTFSLFLTSRSAVFPPYTFRLASSSKSDGLQDAVATPIPSNAMLARIRKDSNNSVTIILLVSAVISLKKLIIADNASDITVIFSAQALFLFRLLPRATRQIYFSSPDIMTNQLFSVTLSSARTNSS